MSTAAELKELLVSRLFLDIAPEEIQDDAPLADYGVDSFLLLESVVAIEEVFGIRFAPKDINAANLRSVSSLAALIAGKKAG
jgi:acyl carrier protein